MTSNDLNRHRLFRDVHNLASEGVHQPLNLYPSKKKKNKLINKQNQNPHAQVQANKNKIYKQHPEITKHVPRCGFEDLRALLTASTHVLPVVHGKDLLPSPKFT
jgi:hypothetical protein